MGNLKQKNGDDQVETRGRAQLPPPVAVTTVSAGGPGGPGGGAGSGLGCGGPNQPAVQGAGSWRAQAG